MIRYLGIGINNYVNAPLRGCVPDIDAATKFFYDRGVPYRHMRTLTDQNTARATRLGIWRRLEWVCGGAKPGDQIIVHYSGHGAQIPERNNGEVDRLTEVLCPVDFGFDNRDTWIRDRDFVDVFSKIPPTVDCTVILDSCFAGGMVDIATPLADARNTPFEEARTRAYPIEDNLDIRIRLESAREKHVPKWSFLNRAAMPNVCFILGCQEDQTSADAYFAGYGFRGALSCHLFKAFADHPRLSRRECAAVATKSLADDGFAQVPMIIGRHELLSIPILGGK